MDSRTLCLGVLTLGDASGYEIKKQVQEGPFAHFHDTSFGSIYPALRKLAADGLVTGQRVSQEGRPDKTVYSITAAGLSAFRAALREKPERDYIRLDTITFLFFGQLMAPEHLRGVYDAYVDELRRKLADMEQWDLTEAPPQRRFVHGLGLSYYRMALDYFETHQDLLFAEETVDA